MNSAKKAVSQKYPKSFKEEKNSSTAFDRSFSLNFGTETDIRDFNGDLVISHDIANKTCLTLTEFLKIYKSKNLSTISISLSSWSFWSSER